MKRIHLFEFQDFDWLPDWLRRCERRLILVMHNLLGTVNKMTGLIAKVLKQSRSSRIVDLCSGSGGPMPGVLQILHKDYNMEEVNLVLTDLHPDLQAAEDFNAREEYNISYRTSPVDATRLDGDRCHLKSRGSISFSIIVLMVRRLVGLSKSATNP